MQSPCLNIELKEKFKLNKGITDFLERVADKSQRWGETVASPIRKTDMAKETGKNPRTITRYINQLEELGLIKTETKRGMNGGTLVVFNTDMLNFEPKENPITSDTKQAKEIREQVFPKAPTKVPKRRYRTKAEIAEARILSEKLKKREDILNDKIEFNVVTRSFFDSFDEPEAYFKGYLISRMYNAYVTIIPYEKYNRLKNLDEKKAKQQLRAYESSYNYDVLPRRFVGTPQYKKFVELAKYCEENNINPLVYLTVQFDRTEFLISVGKARVGATPYVNTLLCAEAKEAYTNRKLFYRMLQNQYGLYTSINSEATYYGATYPIISGLLNAYNMPQKDLSQLDTAICDLEYKKDIDKKAGTLYSYYTATLKSLGESDVSSEAKESIANFLKEQVANFSSKRGLTSTQYALAFPIQINSARSLLMNEEDEELLYLLLGNQSRLSNVTNDEAEMFIKQGRKLSMSWWGSQNFSRTMFMLADYYGFKTNISKLGMYIKEFGEEKIPLDSVGMLDVNRIYDVLMTEQEILEIDKNNWENQKDMRDDK